MDLSIRYTEIYDWALYSSSTVRYALADPLGAEVGSKGSLFFR